MKTALSIAGSDSCGGAGIQADLKTMTLNGVYAMSAITALTAQNTTGVTGIQEVTPEFLQQQIDAVVSDIRPDAVKTGMVSSIPLIKVIASSIKKYGLKNVVVDPVMVATSGAELISDDAIHTLKKELFPLATVITPNIPEIEFLLETLNFHPDSSNLADSISSLKIISEAQMEEAARKIHEEFGCAVLVKGGHGNFGSEVCDFLVCSEGDFWFSEERINNPNTHGTGCTLSSAICACLAKGMDLRQSVENARSYLINTMKGGLNLGKGRGPLLHNFMFQ